MPVASGERVATTVIASAGEAISVFMSKQYYVYMLTNTANTVLYAGVTNDLKRRTYEHKNKLIPGFSSKYNLNKLVYFESTNDVDSAIQREKQIKAGSKQKKIALIQSGNRFWRDLSGEL